MLVAGRCDRQALADTPPGQIERGEVHVREGVQALCIPVGVVLGFFMFINLTLQILWISCAPITGPAAEFYGVSDLYFGLLAMTFMIAFIPLSVPVAWVIDTHGFRLAVSIGAVLMEAFGLLRGLAGTNYALVLLSTVGIAVAQPFLPNAWTGVRDSWFSVKERTAANDLVTLANLAGTALGDGLTTWVENIVGPICG